MFADTARVTNVRIIIIIILPEKLYLAETKLQSPLQTVLQYEASLKLGEVARSRSNCKMRSARYQNSG